MEDDLEVKLETLEVEKLFGRLLILDDLCVRLVGEGALTAMDGASPGRCEGSERPGCAMRARKLQTVWFGSTNQEGSRNFQGLRNIIMK